MQTQVSRHLLSLSAEIGATRSRLARARERLDVVRATLDDARVRMLIAETPLADRELHAAASAHAEIEAEVRGLETQLAGLDAVHRRMSRRVSIAPKGI